jgi:hypothetical protein
MPTINGITASIHTHDGRLEEFDADEFPGGVSCFIVAHSGQQFWLNYSIDHPIRAKAVSVEFHVDGNRVDTQFPLAPEDTDSPATVGPVKSSITSQYGKDETGNVYRRDVFFKLVEKEYRRKRAASVADGHDKIGLIECKIYRAEKTGEWTGTISPEDLPLPDEASGPRPKGVSHTVRLGANIPATKTVRYTFRNLDPEDTPFASFRFYYRSKKFVQRSRIGTWSFSRPSSPFAPASRPASRNLDRRSSLYSSWGKGKLFQLLSGKDDSPEAMRTATPEPLRSSTPPAASTLDLEGTLGKLETQLAKAEQKGEDPERIQNCYDKLEQIRRHSIALRKRKELRADGPIVIASDDGSEVSEHGDSAANKSDVLRDRDGNEATFLKLQ